MDIMKLSIAQKCLCQDGLIWMHIHHLPKNYKNLSKEDQELEMNVAVLKAYDAYMVSRMNLAWNTDDGAFSDDEED
jgi:hypothetical protein